MQTIINNSSNLILNNNTKISLASIFLFIFIFLFPLDSALGNIVGSISINNYFAIFCMLSIMFLNFNRIGLKLNNYNLILLTYFFYCFLTIIFSKYIFITINIQFIFYSIFAILVIGVKWNNKEKQFFENAIILGSFFAILFIFFSIDFNSTDRSFISIGRNIDQNYLTTTFIFSIAYLIEKFKIANSYFKKIIYMLLICFYFLTLLFLGSRGGIISCFVVLFIYSLFSFKKFIIVLLLFSPILFIMLTLFENYIPIWILERFDIKSIISSNGSGRLLIWEDYLNYFFNSNFINIILGNGKGFTHNFYSLLTQKRYMPHNIYIGMLIDCGIIGLIILMTLFVSLIIYSLKNKQFVSLSFILGYMTSGCFLDLNEYRIFTILIIMTFLYNNTLFKYKKEKICIN